MADNLFSQGEIADKTLCCGCAACKDVCPADAIKMSEDEFGFLYPSLCADLCTNCSLCKKVCPFENANKNQKAEKAYACYANDIKIRNDASSGGIFELLARGIIDMGGQVYAAAFDDNFNLCHTMADRIEDIKPMCKSKYLQSFSNDAFSKIKASLSDNKKVLFVGTPCQVGALKNFIKDDQNLVTADFICHGVPSNKMFKDYINYEENRTSRKITEFKFRVKDGKVKHVHGYSYKYTKNGKKKSQYGMFYDNPFYFGFKRYLFFRPSCYNCKYATAQRASDITLGDFWGIEDYLPKIDFNKGVSLVVANTKKGQTFIENLDIYTKSFDISVAEKTNHCFTKTTEKPKNYDEIINDYAKDGFSGIADKYLISKKQIVYKIYGLVPVKLRKLLMKIFNKRKNYV